MDEAVLAHCSRERASLSVRMRLTPHVSCKKVNQERRAQLGTIRPGLVGFSVRSAAVAVEPVSKAGVYD
jgi:hypothetical protein